MRTRGLELRGFPVFAVASVMSRLVVLEPGGDHVELVDEALALLVAIGLESWVCAVEAVIAVEPVEDLERPVDRLEFARLRALERLNAEGVETGELWERLRDLGCHTAQGYFLGRPMPAADLHEWVRARLAAAEV